MPETNTHSMVDDCIKAESRANNAIINTRLVAGYIAVVGNAKRAATVAAAATKGQEAVAVVMGTIDNVKGQVISTSFCLPVPDGCAYYIKCFPEHDDVELYYKETIL